MYFNYLFINFYAHNSNYKFLRRHRFHFFLQYLIFFIFLLYTYIKNTPHVCFVLSRCVLTFVYIKLLICYNKLYIRCSFRNIKSEFIQTDEIDSTAGFVIIFLFHLQLECTFLLLTSCSIIVHKMVTIFFRKINAFQACITITHVRYERQNSLRTSRVHNWKTSRYFQANRTPPESSFIQEHFMS